MMNAAVPRIWLALFVLVAGVAAGCGGGGGASAVSTPGAASTPTIAPTAAPFAQSTSVPLAANGTVTLPGTGGFGGSLSLPASAIAAGTTLALSYTDTAPSGLPALALRRRPLAAQTIATLYVTLSASNAVTLSAAPTLTFAVTSDFPIAGQSYYLAFYDGTQPQLGWQLPFGGPASLLDDVFTVAASSALTLQPNVTYGFALYALENAPTPTPVPTPTPSGAGSITIAVPTAAPIVAANGSAAPVTSATFTSGASSAPQTFTLSEQNYVGTFGASSTNTAVATAAVSTPSPGVYVLTITATRDGTCTIQLTSQGGGTGAISVSVTGP